MPGQCAAGMLFRRSSSRFASTAVLGVAAVLAWSFLAASFVSVPTVTSRAASRGAQRASRIPRASLFGIGAAKELKSELLSLLEDEELAKEVLRPEGKPTRGQLDEMIVKLERLNPTEEPTFSPLLDGDWTVKYSGSYAPGLLSSPTRELALFLYGGGFSLGNALNSFSAGTWGGASGLKVVKQIVQISDGGAVDAMAEVEVLGRVETLSYDADLTPLSGARMSEEITAVKLPRPIGTVEPPLELRRQILVTYLDDEVMIVRDESGVPDVLVREKADNEPAMDDDTVEEEDESNAMSADDSEDVEEDVAEEAEEKPKKEEKKSKKGQGRWRR